MGIAGIDAGGIRLRRGEAHDLPFMYRLERAYVEDLERDQLQGWQNSMEHHLRQWVDDLPRTSIAESGSDKAGYIFWEARQGRAVVASVNVEPGYRRKGIATILLERFEDEASKAGFQIAEVGFVRHNPARKLYGRLGYRMVSAEGRYDIMTKHMQTMP
jgi:GNAT superfamily N-acetyltransferase